MQFGMPTLLELKTLEENAALCCELGLDFIELNMNLPEYQADELDTNHLREVADKYDIYYTMHLDENLNPFDFNNWVAKAYTDTAICAIDKARRLSTPIINMHLNSGVCFTLPDKKVFLFDKYELEYLCKLTAFRDACTAMIGGRDMKICIENCSDFGRLHIQKSLAVLLESPVFAMTFDIGHNATVNYSDEAVIMEHSDRLCHFHIHDAVGRNNHLMFGDGSVNLIKYLNIAKTHDCRAVLEVKTVEGLRRSAEWLKERGYL